MDGPIIRNDPHSNSYSGHSVALTAGAVSEPAPALPSRLLPATDPLNESPQPVSPNSPTQIKPITKAMGDGPARAFTAPKEPFGKISPGIYPPHAETFEPPNFRLDRNAPIRAMRGSGGTVSEDGVADITRQLSSSLELGSPKAAGKRPAIQPLQRGNDLQDDSPTPPKPRAEWGASFPVTWIRVQPVPFNRTRHLRNPWNADRELKVARDGTELEPNVGRQLLALWDEPVEARPAPQPPKKPKEPRNTGGKR